MMQKHKYIIPQQRESYKPSVNRKWLNKEDPQKRTLIVSINGTDHIYPPKAGVILLDKTLNKILIVNNNGYNSSSKWGLPKGHLETDEFPYECASRELYEETGIRINISPKARNYISSINNSIYYIFIVDEKHIKLNPIDTVEILSAKFSYITRLRTIKSGILNKELQKVIGKYIKVIKKKAVKIDFNNFK